MGFVLVVNTLDTQSSLVGLRRQDMRCKNPQLVTQHEQICCMTGCEFDEIRAINPKVVAQSRPVLYFLKQLSSTCNKCFCCATS